MLLFYKGFLSLVWCRLDALVSERKALGCGEAQGLVLARGSKGWEALCPLGCIPPSPEITAQESGLGQV